MTVAELSLEHSNRLTAIETEAEHCKTQHSETTTTMKELSGKLDRVIWGIVSLLAATLFQVGAALLRK
jgi:hypothetical protein